MVKRVKELIGLDDDDDEEEDMMDFASFQRMQGATGGNADNDSGSASLEERLAAIRQQVKLDR